MTPQTVAPLLPVLLTVGGTLLGVMLTLVVQAAVAAKQRVNERQGRAFNLRFELYSDFLNCVESIPMLRQESATFLESQQRTIDLMKEIRDANQELSGLAAEIPESGIIAELAPDRRRDFRAEAEAALQRKKDSEQALVAAEKVVSGSKEKSAALSQRLDEATAQMLRIHQQLRLLSDIRTVEAALAILDRVIVKRQEPTPKEQGDFRRAVKRELGLDSPGLLQRMRIWIKWRWQRWRNKGGAADQLLASCRNRVDPHTQ